MRIPSRSVLPCTGASIWLAAGRITAITALSLSFFEWGGDIKRHVPKAALFIDNKYLEDNKKQIEHFWSPKIAILREK